MAFGFITKPFKKVRNAIRTVRSGWRTYRAVKTAIDELKKGGSMPTTGGTATVPVKSSLFSKINWTVAISVLASVLALFGINLDSETQVQVLAVINGVTAVLVWIFRTFANRTVTPE